MARFSNLLFPGFAAFTLVSVGMAVSGCAEEKVVTYEPAPVEAPAEVTTPAAVPAAGPEHGKKGRNPGRDRITPVYVDGVLVSSLRFSELPPSMPVTWYPLDEGNVVRRFALGDYLTTLGVRVEDVKAVHLYGGRRITAISGDEVRAKATKIHFQFSRDTSGRPQYRHDGPVETNTSIDKINTVAIYLHKPAPEMRDGTLYIDGVEQTRIPYTDGQKKGGTRVYVDGKIVAHLKRRHVADADSKDLASMLREQGVELEEVKSADIVTRDQVARRLTGAELGTAKLTLKETDKGRIAIEQVGEGQAIDAILLVVHSKVVDRFGPAPDGLGKPGLRPITDDARTKISRSSANKGS